MAKTVHISSLLLLGFPDCNANSSKISCKVSNNQSTEIHSYNHNPYLQGGPKKESMEFVISMYSKEMVIHRKFFIKHLTCALIRPILGLIEYQGGHPFSISHAKI